MPRIRLRPIGYICAALLMTMPAYAANMTTTAVEGSAIITISGEIVDGDATRFQAVSRSAAGPTFVVLKSPGGIVMEALQIGEVIRAKDYATAVMNGSVCASACGLIWIAGKSRYIGTTGRVGFHAAYHGSGESARESGAVNALVGAYLTRLGLSYSAVLFATSASPTEMKWLYPGDAEKIGLQVITVPDPEPAAAPVAQKRVADDRPPDGSPLEHRMMELVLAYYGAWSASTGDADDLAEFYGPIVAYYGTDVPREKVMDEKQRFSQRWPLRRYTVHRSTLVSRCAEICSVSGVVEWDVSSPERGAHSIGAANFVVKIAPDGSTSGGVIVSENGAVLSHQADSTPAVRPASPVTRPGIASSSSSTLVTPAQQAASATTAYADGQQARMTFEAWFTGLNDGPFREGAAFWTSNRSLRPPPSCNQPGMNDTWQTGCATVQVWFVTVDRRRNTENDYRWGWNSL